MGHSKTKGIIIAGERIDLDIPGELQFFELFEVAGFVWAQAFIHGDVQALDLLMGDSSAKNNSSVNLRATRVLVARHRDLKPRAANSHCGQDGFEVGHTSSPY